MIFDAFNNIIILLFDFRALFQKNDVADYEATAFSIFYNNALFLVIVVLLSFYLLKGFSTTAYPFKLHIKSQIIFGELKH